MRMHRMEAGGSAQHPAVPPVLPPPPQPYAAPAPAKQSRHPVLHILVVVVAAAVLAFGVFMIARQVTKSHAISKQQWQSLRFGSTPQQMTDKFGKKPASQATADFGNRPSLVSVYRDRSGHHSAVFNFSRDRLFSKAWSDYDLSKTTISSTERVAARRMAAGGATQRQFERRFGSPIERTIVAGSAGFLPPAYRGMFVSGRSSCIAWLLKENTSRRFQMCFDPRSHKALAGVAAPLGLRGALQFLPR